MHVAARVRLFLARRPWVYWLVVVLCAAGVGLGVRAAINDLDDARESWGTTRSVLVARRDHQPGDHLDAMRVELPEAALPPTAVDAIPPEQRLRQRVAAGEVLVEADFVAEGPAARADPGTIVVAVSDPLARDLVIGSEVVVAADGVVLADPAVVVELIDEIAFVAVDPADAALVAAAARLDTASVLYRP